MSTTVRDFLLEFKKAVTSASGVYLVPREDTLATLQYLGLTKKNLEEILLSLSVSDYCRGPEADRDRDGQLWIFGKRLRGHEIYIKLPQINGISALGFLKRKNSKALKSCNGWREKDCKVHFLSCCKISFVLSLQEVRMKRSLGGIAMISICPGCEKETHIERIEKLEQFEVRGEIIEIFAEFHRCSECHAEFENTREPDALAEAYREYRQRHDMLQPEDIQEWRKSLGLTQKELSTLLGWGGATLSRYENGALQDEAHEKMLRMAREPHNLLSLLKAASPIFAPEKRERLIKELAAVEAEAISLNRIFEDRFCGYPPDEFSGFLKFYLLKFQAAVLFFCKGGQLKTKLNKLLFYADFKHFKENAVSITGARYVHLPHGPVPDNYEYFFATLIHSGEMDVDEIPVYQYFGENYTATREARLSIFEPSELKILAEVKEYFQDFSATQIRDFSHEELGYRETANRQHISFIFATKLNI